MVDAFALPPEEAVAWFREKGFALTEDWRDLWEGEHARAFSVARVTQLDLLADIREHVDRAIAEGRSLNEFRRDLRPVLQERGWWGEREVTDPETGEVTIDRMGSPARLRTIYETNLRTAHAAGRWERMQRTARTRPYGRYVAILDGRERAEHRQWHGIVLPLDHPWWNTHAPPNGWGCRCKIQQLSERDLTRFGYEVSPDPAVRLVSWNNPRTGQAQRIPAGIDAGFAYNPGNVERGFVPPPARPAPTLQPAQTFRDFNRPAASSIEAEQSPPASWPASRTQDRDRFQRLFNIDAGAEPVARVTDPTGMQTLFDARALGDATQARATPQARDAVERPYEVWAVPSRLPNGRVVMRHRYVGMPASDGSALVATRTDEGYVTWATYTRQQLDAQREGYLVWPRKSEP